MLTTDDLQALSQSLAAKRKADEDYVAMVARLFPKGAVVQLKQNRLIGPYYLTGTIDSDPVGPDNGYYLGSVVFRNQRTGKTRRIYPALEIQFGDITVLGHT